LWQDECPNNSSKAVLKDDSRPYRQDKSGNATNSRSQNNTRKQVIAAGNTFAAEQDFVGQYKNWDG